MSHFSLQKLGLVKMTVLVHLEVCVFGTQPVGQLGVSVKTTVPTCTTRSVALMASHMTTTADSNLHLAEGGDS